MDLFVNYCRLCRTESDPSENWPTLTQPGCEHLLEKIQSCTGVHIAQDDDLPKRICWRCEASLDQASTFRLQCREADAWWKEKAGKSAPVASVYVKPELQEDEFEEPLETILKVEPDITEDADYEPAKEDASSDEFEESTSSKKAKPKKKAAGGSKEFRCNLCSKQFAKNQTLQDHLARHSGVRNFSCTVCDNSFFTERHLKAHIERQHAENRPFECNQCDRKFVFEGQLTEHLISHTDNRPFSCELCSKAFKTKGQLKAHLGWVHQPEEIKDVRRKANQRICVCSFCGKVSTTVKTHQTHLRTHTGEQNHECNICCKRFSALSSFRKHMLVHTDERPYQCEHCEKAFRQRHHLKTHIRGVHSNERPFQCRFCDRSFVTRQSMRFHEKTHGEPLDGQDLMQ